MNVIILLFYLLFYLIIDEKIMLNVKYIYNDVIAAGKQEQSGLPILKERFRSHQKSLALISCCKIKSG